MSTTPAFASIDEALETPTSAMSYLDTTDATQMSTELQARCLQTFERVDAAEIVAVQGPGGVHRRERLLFYRPRPHVP
jgi:hypothetical protein